METLAMSIRWLKSPEGDVTMLSSGGLPVIGLSLMLECGNGGFDNAQGVKSPKEVSKFIRTIAR